jgi:two-component system chemotaxis response regulator CheY
MSLVLIVDDSETSRTQLRNDLQGASHTVVEAADGEEGLKKLASNPSVDIVISDVNMPNMDGLTMVSKIRQNSTHAKLKIFMLTTEATVDMKEKGKKAGVNAWIVKPYAKDKLLMAMEKILQK